MNMKKQLIIIFLLLNGFWAQGQNPETVVNSKVKEVTVFRNGIQELRSGKTAVPAGNSVLKFTGLATDINPNSIQLKGVENFTILSIIYRINYLAGEEASPEVKMLQDSINLVNDKLNYLKKKIYVNDQHRKLYTDNRNMVGKDNSLYADELEEMIMLYGKKLGEIETDLMDLKVEESKWSIRLNSLTRQLNTFSGSTNKGTGEILVDVKASSKIASTDVVLSYYLYSGGWTPFYDIRAKDTKSNVEIAYKANVLQRTGTDWENVDMKLSSASPNFTNTLPELASWQLNYAYIQDYKSGKASGNGYSQAYTWDYGDGTVTNSNGNSTTKQSAGFEFVIDKPYSIPSDGKEYVVEIGKSSVNTTFSYYAVPKMDEAAFILARLTNWYELNLLPGKTNIYLGNSYVGETYLNPEIVEDTLDISLGNDEAIIVKRINVSDMNSKSLTGNTRKRTDEWELSFRNNHSYPVKIKVLDQIPVSTEKEVVVTADNYEGAQYNKETGELSWMLHVAESETKKVRFKYTVKYPKNKIITNF